MSSVNPKTPHVYLKMCLEVVLKYCQSLGSFKNAKRGLYNRFVGRSKKLLGLKFEYNVELGGTHFLFKNIFHMCKGTHTRARRASTKTAYFGVFRGGPIRSV